MKRKILVIEDDADIRQVISNVLIDEGFETILCKNEKNIFEVILLNNPDVILLDVIRPTQQGTELCRTIKAAETTKHIPIIVLSTHSQIDDVKKICADDIVKKPFDIQLLIDVVNEQICA
ncbi:MAG: response regulator [Flavobacterium sp.]|nr:response regulator [Pedobacter sp.]